MRNFKKAVLAVVILLIFERAACFLLEPVTYKHYLDIDLKKMKEAGETPQLIFVGDSRVYRTFIPSIFEEKMETVDCAVNIGTGSQSIKGSYYYLKDMIKRYRPKYAVVGIDHIQFMEEMQYATFQELTVIDRIKTPSVMLESIPTLLEVKDYPYLLGSYRYRDYVDKIAENVTNKLDEDVRLGIDKREPEHYEYRGFVHTSTGFREGNVGIDEDVIQWKGDTIKKEACEYLDRIVTLCRENDMELFFVTAPTTLSTIYSIEDYEGFVDFFKEYGEEREIIYQDLNLIDQRQTVLPDNAMYDSDHVNGNGAKTISNLYCEILEKNIAGEATDEYFYSSVDEMKADIGRVVACDFHTEVQSDGNYKIIAESLTTEGKIPEYEFALSADGGATWEILQEYGTEAECVLAKEDIKETKLLRVNCRLIESTAPFEAFMEKSGRR